MLNDSVIGTIFKLHSTMAQAKQFAVCETDQTAMIRTVNISVPCKHYTYHFSCPYMMYIGFKLDLLRELIINDMIPNIIDTSFLPANETSIKQFTWVDVETIQFGKTANDCRVYLGPNPINLVPMNIEARYGRRLPR